MTYHEMQRDRDSEICLIHFTLIHRLALPDTTTSLTVMLLCMIAPGLDSSITAVSVRFFLIEASLIDSPWTQQSQEPFWQRQIHKLLELLVPAPLACCQGLTSLSHYAVYPFPANFFDLTKMQYVISHKCILYPSVGLRLTNSFASFKTVFNVFSQNKVLLWVGSQDAKGEFWAGEELHACLLGLDMTPWTGHVSL